MKNYFTIIIIEPIVATQDKNTGELIIISGHQRTRASIELEKEEIMCDIKVYNDEDSIIKDLIETNIRQRGDVSSSSLKMGRIIRELERIYNIRQGSSGKSDMTMSSGKSITQHSLTLVFSTYTWVGVVNKGTTLFYCRI